MKKKYYKIKSPTRAELWIIRTMILIGIISLVHFFVFFFRTEYRGYTPLYILLTIIVIFGAFRRLYLWYHYFSISVPVKPKLKQNVKVDILTTYFPGEPVEMIVKTLTAIKKIDYPHTSYLCDEANDPYLRKQCEKLGVVHVTRNNRIDAKAGNINNALRQATGEICVILDPDHIPKPHFLANILPYFNDERIGFVQIVQGYYNKYETLVAKGAAEQTFQFYGPMMMTMNTYGTVNAVGANCTFRRAALDSIGGHAPGLAEDLHTAMLMHAEGWTSVYVPEFLAKGLVPTELTSYYKQQLKWARGTFELLYSVYPKIFTKLSLRQKIHYALVPFHYLIGFIYFLAFLIPMLSLFLSKMPWTGNILYFIAMSAPVVMSSILIRSYIQKWVIEKNERGFHIIGGILQIITWWIYILGVVYTFTRKKIPFIPTPKEEQNDINFSILIPNLLIGCLSVIAIVYGLMQDFTPFTIVMSFFAVMNALFMFFSIYLSLGVTNKNKILRANLQTDTVRNLTKVKGKLRSAFHSAFMMLRPIALPILILSFVAALFWIRNMDRNAWENVGGDFENQDNFAFLGVFSPTDDEGLSDIEQIDALQKKWDADLQIASFYLAWGTLENSGPLETYLDDIGTKGLMPLITWEPWSSNFVVSDSIPELKDEKRILHHIQEGVFDDYIKQMALLLKEREGTLFLRFAHEFDNPAYPWSMTGNNTPEEFKAAWRYVHDIFAAEKVDNVVWVWNPWRAEKAMDYYPGDDYVDWIGATLLNYGSMNPDGKWYDFKSLYRPFHAIYKTIQKPVMLTEFGSLKLGGSQEEWMLKAFEAIDSSFNQIMAVVFFNSTFDKNLPLNTSGQNIRYLDWTLNTLPKTVGGNSLTSNKTNLPLDPTSPDSIARNKKIIPIKNFRGVAYKKSDNWLDNYYIASKEILKNDLNLMEDIGLDLVKFTHTPIYDYNLLKYTSEERIDILYTFWIPDNQDFLVASESLSNLKKEILNTVHELKNNRTVVGWNIANEPWSTAKTVQGKFIQRQQREAYLNWLRQLVEEIKEIDANRFLTIEMELTESMPQKIEQIKTYDIQMDAIGLIVRNGELLNNFLENTNSSKTPYIINSISPKTYATFYDQTVDVPVIFENWQNQRENLMVTFDGILDFSGRKKEEYKLLRELWKPGKEVSELPEIKILRDAVPVGVDKRVRYRALVKQSSGWQIIEDDASLKMEWQLVKNDVFGNSLALKKIGVGNSVYLNIPENHNNYQLRLSVTKNGFSVATLTTLNTPLIQ